MQLQSISSPITGQAAPQKKAAAAAEATPQDQFASKALEGETQFADSYGRVKHLALMLSSYVGGEARDQVLDAYKTLFTKMEPDTKFTIVVEDNGDKQDVEKVIKDNHINNPERIQFLQPNVGSLTVWARDMMVPEFLKNDNDHTALLSQQTMHSWHDNDAKVPAKITAADPSILLDVNKSLVTDGGDVMSTTKDCFVGNYSITATSENLAKQLDSDPKARASLIDSFQRRTGKQVVDDGRPIQLPQLVQDVPVQNFANGPVSIEHHIVGNANFQSQRIGPGQASLAEAVRDTTVQMFEKQLGKPVTVMGADDPSTPDHVEEPATDHMDMGLTPVDDKTIFVGDPGLANQIVGSMTPAERQHAEAVLSHAAGHPVSLTSRNRDNQEDFDAYARTVQGKGYNVLRMPHLEPGFSSSYITYNNCLMERFEKDGKEVRRVFLPNYDIPKLDDYAKGVWQSQGFEVIPMPLGALSERWGALRCISNWLDRSPRG